MNEPGALAIKMFSFILHLIIDATHGDRLVDKGENLFLNHCASCHAMTSENKNAFGPSLHGVVGRRAGIAPSYNYSRAILESSIIWTEDNLDGYLMNPQKYVGLIVYTPHRYLNITFSGFVDDTDQKAVITFLGAN